MHGNLSFGIDFVARKCKADKKRADIFARITINGELKEISIKEQIDTCDWVSEKEAVKGKTLEARATNERIESVRFRLRDKYRSLDDAGALITADTVKAAYLGVQSLQRGHKLIELTDYYKKIWEEKLRRGGFKNYKTTIDYIQRFLSHKYANGDIFLSQLSIEVITEFEHYVRTNPIKCQDPCLGNGLAKHVQRFKRIISWAVELKWLKTNPINTYSCPIKKTKRKKLTIQELVALEEQDFTNDTVRYVRDLFVYSCYTGLAYVDVMALKESHFEWQPGGTVWCYIYRTKSDELCGIPLLKRAANILNLYKTRHVSNECNTNVFKRISNQEINRSLKIIKEICRIETPMTYHVARHTFAKTVALKNGVPLETVQIMMGHTKITTTQIYADVDEEKVMDDLAGIEEKLQIKRDLIMASKLISYM